MKVVVLFTLAVALGGVTNAAAKPRTFMLRGQAIDVEDPQDPEHHPVQVELLVSAEEQTLLETLAHGGWEPVDAGDSCEPDVSLQGEGAAYQLEIPDGGAGRLSLWRRPEQPLALPLWMASFDSDAGGPDLVREALADGISQQRIARTPLDAGIPWVELRWGPFAAEDAPLPDELDPDADPVSQDAVTRVPNRPKQLALTFDACATLDPSKVDDKVIAALEEAQAPATLFMSGAWAEARPDLVMDLARNPLFEIGNHSYSHPHMTSVSPNRRREEILWTQRVLFQLTGIAPTLFRPPYGEYDEDLAAMAAQMGLTTIEYDLPSGDPDPNFSAQVLTKWVLSRATRGSIIVMHMNGRGRHTAEALPGIIKGLRAKGFTLSKVSELLRTPPESPRLAGAPTP